ncbi:PLP-dependent transferase [Coprinopsis marcescibilis]|uniref:PLP-dependent transferase n=1 Tax=Coprinopsis marcescibilis TaxID=230819 RepID=A0A5C3KG71_COPMA|nr:PLP-dependent transferase [Coprinopsis marcescibilis]
MHPTLQSKLQKALQSREERLIRRRLPDPISSKANPNSSENLIDFTSNDYLSLTQSRILRDKFLQKLGDAPDILGSGGSRLLVNGQAHAALEKRLADFFKSPIALLFNSGFDANVGFFGCIPQTGDAIVYDEYIHASVHDGMRGSRVSNDRRIAFRHNSVEDLRRVLVDLKRQMENQKPATETFSVFVAVESLYSMDGTFSPLTEICDSLDQLFPAGNAYLVVDEAHSTGIYGPQGRGRVSQLGLEHRVLARLVTFGKALGATGAVVLTNELVRDYLLNYARPLIYTTSLSYSNIIAADASFDLLTDGTAGQLSAKLQDLSTYFTSTLQQRLTVLQIPPKLLSLPQELRIQLPALSPSPPDSSAAPAPASSASIPPSPIIPLLTNHPRPLSAHLRSLDMNARPITWPTVPKGKDRVRVCLHAGNTKSEIDKLIEGAVGWAVTLAERERRETLGGVGSSGQRSIVAFASKL